MFKNILKKTWEYTRNESGYGTTELLLLFAGAAMLATTVLVNVLPSLKGLYLAMVDNFKDISGSGY